MIDNTNSQLIRTSDIVVEDNRLEGIRTDAYRKHRRKNSYRTQLYGLYNDRFQCFRNSKESGFIFPQKEKIKQMPDDEL